jgi:hypothetical protein
VLAVPEAAKVPGSAVAPVSAAQEAEDAVWVVLTKPLVPVQVVESAPFMLMLTLVAPAPLVLKTKRTDVAVPVAILLILT